MHIVLSREFLPGNTAIMVPHTRDGRVMFAIPWHGHTLIGTTDTPIPETVLEPDATSQEIDFILETASDYLAKRPSRADVLSVFTGIRPLVKAGDVANTAALSRDHTIEISASGMLTIAGGKWTTYRHMAEDAVDHAIVLGRLEECPCVTRDLHLHGFHRHAEQFGELAVYGSDALEIEEPVASRPSTANNSTKRCRSIGRRGVWFARHKKWRAPSRQTCSPAARGCSFSTSSAALAMQMA